MTRLALTVLLLTAGCSASAPASVMPGGQPSVKPEPLPGKAGTRERPTLLHPFGRVLALRVPARRADRDEQRAPLHDWTAVGRCESGGDPHINTGNGYYGYLQESLSFWASFGGLKFAARPDLATREQQITVAERGLIAQGIGAWPICGRYIKAAA